MATPLVIFFLCSLIGWFKGNANKIGLCDLSLLEWTLYTSIPTSFAMLWAFWKILDKYGAWTANLWIACIGLAVTLCMNTIWYGVEVKKAVALFIILIISLIAR